MNGATHKSDWSRLFKIACDLIRQVNADAPEQYADAIIGSLRAYPEAVQTTLKKTDQLNPDFVNRAIQALMIRDSFRSVSNSAIERTKEILAASLVGRGR